MCRERLVVLVRIECCIGAKNQALSSIHQKVHVCLLLFCSNSYLRIWNFVLSLIQPSCFMFIYLQPPFFFSLILMGKFHFIMGSLYIFWYCKDVHRYLSYTHGLIIHTSIVKWKNLYKLFLGRREILQCKSLHLASVRIWKNLNYLIDPMKFNYSTSWYLY